MVAVLRKKIITICFIMFAINFSVIAEEIDSLDHSIEETGWEFGVFIGYLKVSIPLRDAKELPPIFPFFDIAYYSEKFFFDKWAIGYQLINDSAYSVSVVASILEDSLYFIEEQDDIGSRRVAASGGLEIFFSRPWGDVSWQGLYDITQAHNGYLMEMYYAFPSLDRGFWRLDSRFGVSYKSGKLFNYYYGVRRDEVSNTRPAYSASGGNNFFWELEAKYQVTEYWQLKTLVLYNNLSDEIGDSPLVDKTSFFSYFIGLGYEW